MAVGLTLLGRIYKRYFEGGIKSEAVIAALKHVRRHLAGRFILIYKTPKVSTGPEKADFGLDLKG